MTTRLARSRFAIPIAGALLAWAGVARADETAQPAPVPARWYGYQTLLVDVVPLVALPIGIVATANEAKGDNNPIVGVTIAGLGATSYLFAAPTVHWAHGRVGIGFLSLGMRILGPVAGLGLGAVGSQIATNSKNQVGIPIGAAVGALAAMIVDGVVLGWERVPDR